MDILPDEIFEEIFAEVALSVEDVEWKVIPWCYTAFIPMSLGLVCKRWHEITLATPFIWSFIVVHQAVTQSQVHLCLARSSHYPLHLIIISRPWWIPRRDLPSITSQIILNNILTYHLSRCESIIYDMNDDEPEDGALFLEWISEQRERLTSLSRLCLKSRAMVPLLTPLFPGGLPCLKYLELGPGHICVPYTGVSFTQVRTLHLHLKDKTLQQSLTTLRHFLMLHTLVLYDEPSCWDLFSVEHGALHFPYLSTLISYNCDTHASIIHIMELPALEYVAVLNVHPSAFDRSRKHKEICPRIFRNTPLFRKLSISFPPTVQKIVSEHEIDSLFACFPDIQEVALLGIATAAILKALKNPVHGNKRWPNLHTIELETGSTEILLSWVYEIVQLRKNRIQVVRSDDEDREEGNLDLMSIFKDAGVRMERSDVTTELGNQLSLPLYADIKPLKYLTDGAVL